MNNKTFGGKRYLMRDQRPKAEILAMYAAYCAKFGPTDLHRWLVERGKVYRRILPFENAHEDGHK